MGCQLQLPQWLGLVAQVGQGKICLEVWLLRCAIRARRKAQHGIRGNVLLLHKIQRGEPNILPRQLSRDVLGSEIVAAVPCDGDTLGRHEHAGCVDLLALYCRIHRQGGVRLAIRHAISQGDVAATVQIAQRARDLRVDVCRARELHIVLLAGDLQEVGDLRIG